MSLTLVSAVSPILRIRNAALVILIGGSAIIEVCMIRRKAMSRVSMMRRKCTMFWRETTGRPSLLVARHIRPVKLKMVSVTTG